MLEETLAVYLIVAGALLGLAGLIGLWMAAARIHWAWLLGLLLPPSFPVVAVAFAIRHRRQARWPTGLLLVGLGLAVTPAAVNRIAQHFLDLGPREKWVDGEMHLTLTGWEQDDYSILRLRPGAVVVQMANPDVNDATLEYLRGMKALRVLDLNDTAITDAGLETIAALPALEELRLARTRITDEGFRRHLLDKPSLRAVDLTGTPVKGKTKRTWEDTRPGRLLID